VAKIRLDSRKSTRPFKGIICDDISEFESHMPSQTVGSQLRQGPRNPYEELIAAMVTKDLFRAARLSFSLISANAPATGLNVKRTMCLPGGTETARKISRQTETTRLLPATGARFPASPAAALRQAPVAERPIVLPPVQGRSTQMAPLFFTCPTTHREAPTGIETDVQSLQAAWKATLKIKCPYCGEMHQISVRETYINGALKDATDWSWGLSAT
jgi:hypothetical protein